MQDNTKLKQSPWLTMWIKPRETMREILNKHYPEYIILILSILSSIDGSLNRAVSQNLGDKGITYITIILKAIGEGIIIGIPGIYLGAGLIKLIGKGLDGQGSFNDIKKVLAWTNIPIIWGMVFWIPKIILFKQELFTSETTIINSNWKLFLVYHFVGVIEFIIGIWALVIFLKCLSEVQKFSVWKALLNIFLMILLFIVFALLIVAMF